MCQGKRRWPSSLTQEDQICPSSHLFVLFQPSVDWMMLSHWLGQSSLLSVPIQMLISSTNILTDIPRNNILPASWSSLTPVKLTHKVNHDGKGASRTRSQISRLLFQSSFQFFTLFVDSPACHAKEYDFFPIDDTKPLSS